MSSDRSRPLEIEGPPLDAGAIVLGTAGQSAATQVAERILDRMQAPFFLEGGKTFLSVSIGVASAAAPPNEPRHLLRDADRAMYEAKKGGKACYTLFDDGMSSEYARRAELESGLREALKRG